MFFVVIGIIVFVLSFIIALYSLVREQRKFERDRENEIGFGEDLKSSGNLSESFLDSKGDMTNQDNFDSDHVKPLEIDDKEVIISELADKIKKEEQRSISKNLFSSESDLDEDEVDEEENEFKNRRLLSSSELSTDKPAHMGEHEQISDSVYPSFGDSANKRFANVGPVSRHMRLNDDVSVIDVQELNKKRKND